jgi:hypothetical protein
LLYKNHIKEIKDDFNQSRNYFFLGFSIPGSQSNQVDSNVFKLVDSAERIESFS